MNSDFLSSNNIVSLINTVRSNVNQEINYDITQDKKYINVLKKLVKTIHEANINKRVSIQYLNNLVVTKCVPFLVNQVRKSNNEKINSKNIANIYGNLPTVTSDRPVATRMNDYSNENNIQSKKSTVSGMDFSSLELNGAGSRASNPETNTFEPLPRQMPNLNQSNLNNNNLQQSNTFEPPPRQMPNLNQSNLNNNNLQQSNMQSNIMNQNMSMNIESFNIQNDNENRIESSNLAGINTKDVDNVDIAKRLEEIQKERDYETNSTTSFESQTQQLQLQNDKQIDKYNLQKQNEDNDFFKNLAENQVNNPQEDLETNRRSKEISDMNLSKLSNNYMDVSDYDIDYNSYNSYNYENNSINNSNNIASSDRDMESDSKKNGYIVNNSPEVRQNINDFKNNINDVDRNIEGVVSTNNIIKNDNKEVNKEYIDSTFISTNYIYERRKRKILSLDISNFLPDLAGGLPAINNISNTYWGKFKINLSENLIIDKISDIYIESIIINNPALANMSNLYILMDIEEFNIKTVSNNTFMSDKFVLPNENTESNGASKIMKYHLKSNYVATINPTKLSSLTFNITNENGDSIDGDNFTDITNAANISATINASITTSTSALSVNNLAEDSIIRVFDALYNSSNEFIGNSFTTSVANNLPINLLKNSNVVLTAGESLRKPSGHTDGFFPGNINSNTSILNTSPNLNTLNLNIGDVIYLGTGRKIGKISNIDIVNNQVTLEDPTTFFIPAQARIYNSNPLPKVFASNSKSNRIILELAIISR